MWREETIEEISDGRLYSAQDLVKIGTDDCRGCCDCCRMGPVIVLDPLDVFELNRFLSQSFEELLNETIELKVIDGLILPVLKLVPGGSGMHTGQAATNPAAPSVAGPRTDTKPDSTRMPDPEEPMVCPYLGEDGRCTIHAFRPGICRLYPLGRSWEGDDFSYILQVNECTRCNKTKIKVKKWLGIPDLASYEQFCRDWHSLLSSARRLLDGTAPDSKLRNQICIYLLQQFFLCDWNVDDFYEVFAQRRAEALRHLGFTPPADMPPGAGALSTGG